VTARFTPFNSAKEHRRHAALFNKPRHTTTTSRPVSMISRNYNPNPVIDMRRRW